MVQDFIAQELTGTLGAMAKTGADMPDLFESLSAEAAEE